MLQQQHQQRPFKSEVEHGTCDKIDPIKQTILEPQASSEDGMNRKVFDPTAPNGSCAPPFTYDANGYPLYLCPPKTDFGFSQMGYNGEQMVVPSVQQYWQGQIPTFNSGDYPQPQNYGYHATTPDHVNPYSIVGGGQDAARDESINKTEGGTNIAPNQPFVYGQNSNWPHAGHRQMPFAASVLEVPPLKSYTSYDGSFYPMNHYNGYYSMNGQNPYNTRNGHKTYYPKPHLRTGHPRYYQYNNGNPRNQQQQQQQQHSGQLRNNQQNNDRPGHQQQPNNEQSKSQQKSTDRPGNQQLLNGQSRNQANSSHGWNRSNGSHPRNPPTQTLSHQRSLPNNYSNPRSQQQQSNNHQRRHHHDAFYQSSQYDSYVTSRYPHPEPFYRGYQPHDGNFSPLSFDLRNAPRCTPNQWYQTNHYITPTQRSFGGTPRTNTYRRSSWQHQQENGPGKPNQGPPRRPGRRLPRSEVKNKQTATISTDKPVRSPSQEENQVASDSTRDTESPPIEFLQKSLCLDDDDDDDDSPDDAKSTVEKVNPKK
ncbi:myb-like protein AA [Varroa jacobsoni]|uniref:myb-like protein AA n=1 Tax=Varroa jacobsoni TaxID=62625 RepID=UPI000BF46072|nr:myb-like protein AA [Varroa jacobsoni]